MIAFSKEVTFVPGLYQIFDELLVNAADNKIKDISMDTIRVDIDLKLTTYASTIC
jgi:DNA topoisomerase-2